ncbi:hypothetical protein [Leptolyngbya ohadii]|uniref:hypothetical protein n=1 Tax=Leptolyngbya ohadii TaxID=1962290 RepID=UPI00117B223C|nr:hypothetical protein [Leptolyngbya ohadii]
MAATNCIIYVEAFDSQRSMWFHMEQADEELEGNVIAFENRVPCIGEEFRFAGAYYKVIRVIWSPFDNNDIAAQLCVRQCGAD